MVKPQVVGLALQGLKAFETLCAFEFVQFLQCDTFIKDVNCTYGTKSRKASHLEFSIDHVKQT